MDILPLDLLFHKPANSEDFTYIPISDIISSEAFQNSLSPLSFAVGKNTGGEVVIGDLEKAIHLLVAGTTGMGKSAFIHSLLISLLYKSSPDNLRMVIIDPSGVEMQAYNGIPHLYIPVVTDSSKSLGALEWIKLEIQKRFRLFAELNTNNMYNYNDLVSRAGRKEYSLLPSIVLVIDGLASLILGSDKARIEDAIQTITQSGRAAGVHLVVSTPRPSSKVLAGILKANIPTRISFGVASTLESKMIMDYAGAECLCNPGEMLYLPVGSKNPIHVQAAYTDDYVLHSVLGHLKFDDSHYDEIIYATIKKAETMKNTDSVVQSENPYDSLFAQAVDLLFSSNTTSVSTLQRQLKLGYSRAARIIDQMEEAGIVGPFEGAKPRKIIITEEQWVQMKSKYI